jgi:hypothetical protein
MGYGHAKTSSPPAKDRRFPDWHRRVWKRGSRDQNPAMNALLCLDKRVLQPTLPGTMNAVRANQQINAPLVMTREQIRLPTGLFDLPLQCQLVPP